jgi:hypothetical protein
MLDNQSRLNDVLFRGKRLLSNVIDQVSEVSVEIGTDQVTELSFTIEDPDFKILSSGVFDLNTKVTYRKLQLLVAVIETGPGGGLGGFTVRCRPEIVSKLKKRRGSFVMNKVSPTTFITSEVKKAGGKIVAQPSPVRGRVTRDVPQKGEKYDEASFPSTWTTMQRLADELGYLMFEVAGTIYFGKPTWLIRNQPKVRVAWYPENGNEPYSVPEFRQSIDSTDVELNLELPIERAGSVLPGYGINIVNFPKFAGTYFITNVSYPLIGPGTVSVTASTAKNPEPQKAGDEKGTRRRKKEDDD